MTMSRRDVMTMLPALAAAGAVDRLQAAAQGTAQGAPQGPAPSIPGKVFHSAQIPYTGNETKKARRFFYGAEHSGFTIEMHETVLGPGVVTHEPHSHPHEEIIIIVEGTVEVSIDGVKEIAETGSVIHYEPVKPHNLRNAGTTPCRYYVVELRGKPA